MRRSSGIFLIITLLTATVIFMFVGASLALGPMSLAWGTNLADQASAQRAADAGLEYAQCRLRENPAWKGDGGPGLLVDSPGLVVREDRGCVTGLVRQPDGQVAQFRLRFNFYDGSGSGSQDGLDDPAAADRIDMEEISVNNLLGHASTVIPKANPSAGWRVTAPTTGEPLMARSVGLNVEGRAGSALRALSSSNPNAAADQGRLTRAVALGIYRNNLPQPASAAAVMSGGAQDYRVGPAGGKVILESTSGVPGLRTRSRIGVRDDTLSAGELEIVGGSAQMGTENGSNSDVVADQVGSCSYYADTGDFYNIKWSDVIQADKTPTTTQAVHIPAGVYVSWEGDLSLHYYDMNFAEYKLLMATQPGNPGKVIASSDLQEVRTSIYGVDDSNSSVPGVAVAKDKMVFSQDTYVVPHNGVDDFCYIPRRGFALQPGDPNNAMVGIDNAIDLDGRTINELEFKLSSGVIFSTEGDIRVGANLKADSATIATAGNLMAAAGSVDVTGAGSQGLNIYSKRNIVLSTFNEATGEFSDVSFKGMVYAWRAFRAFAGAGDFAWKNFKLEGALVAYGADPLSSTPGSTGKVEIMANTISLKWDGSQLGGLVMPTSSALRLGRCYYALR